MTIKEWFFTKNLQVGTRKNVIVPMTNNLKKKQKMLKREFSPFQQTYNQDSTYLESSHSLASPQVVQAP